MPRSIPASDLFKFSFNSRSGLISLSTAQSLGNIYILVIYYFCFIFGRLILFVLLKILYFREETRVKRRFKYVVGHLIPRVHEASGVV